MNKKHNRLIATARQYALVTFLGLGMSFAVVKAAVKSQKSATMTEQEWLYDGVGDPTSPGSYSKNKGDDLADQCPGSSEVCGIIAPLSSDPNFPEHPEIDTGLADEILEGSPSNRVFMRN